MVSKWGEPASGTFNLKVINIYSCQQISEATVARCRRELGLFGSRVMAAKLPDTTKHQLVLDQLANDPCGRRGPRIVKELITNQTGIMLPRFGLHIFAVVFTELQGTWHSEYIRGQMMLQEPEGFATREPTSKKLSRKPLVVLSPHHEWSGDSHDKLTQIGFPIWGIRDVWSGKWLSLWVLSNNQLKNMIAYLYLSLCHQLGGMLNCCSSVHS